MAERADDNPGEPMSAKRSPIVDYRTPTTAPGSQRQPLVSEKLAIVSILFAFGAFVAFALAGVSSDRIAIPLSKKVVLTITAVAATAATQLSTVGRARGCATMVTLYALLVALELGVMWFWN